VISVRALITVAEITTSLRAIGAEVLLDHRAVGLERESAVNCDGLHTVTRASLTHRVGQLDATTMDQVCSALHYALGC
jgi:mRNA-degrading endonuclease toxin of MazEF toxin-antitoxin module